MQEETTVDNNVYTTIPPSSMDLTEALTEEPAAEEPELIPYEEPEVIEVQPEEPSAEDKTEDEVVFPQLPENEDEHLDFPSFQEDEPVVSDADEVSEFEQEAINDREILEEQVAKDVDAALYRKLDEETLETENDVNPDVLVDEEPELSESDLDFIQSMPIEDNNQEVYTSDEFEQAPDADAAPTVEDLENSVLDEGAIEELDVDNSHMFIDDDDDGSTDDSQMVPIYTPEEMKENDENAPLFESGDVVSHPKYGQGVVEKMINYGNKTLCSISFVNIGRRLLDPNLSELKLVSRGGVIVNN